MRHAFQQLPELRAQLETVDSAPVQALREKMGEFAELRDLLERAIIDTPPVLVRDGGVIASGYNEELDEWRALADGATDYLERLEVRERERTGLDTLKVGFNGARLLHSNQPWAKPSGTHQLHASPDAEKRRALHHSRAKRVRR